MRVLEVVAAVITDDAGRVLACRRKPDLASGGAWEFPGGKIEAGETPVLALEREIQEELGVRIRIGEHLTTDDTMVGDLVIRLGCYLARINGEIPTHSTDHDELVWLAPNDLAGREWATPDLPVVGLLGSQR